MFRKMIHQKSVFITGVFAVFVWALLIYSVPVSAEELQYTDPDTGLTWKYSILNEELKTASINGYSGTGTDIVIPGVIEGYSVTEIGDHAFDHSQITSVVIPEGVSVIGGSAFRYCKYITEVSIPGSVSEFGSTIFDGCTDLTRVILCDGVKSIGYQMFWGCDKLSSIIIPSSVIEIGGSAFSYCYGLDNIIIPCDFDKSILEGNGDTYLIVNDDEFIVDNHNESLRKTGSFIYTHDWNSPTYSWASETKDDGSVIWKCTAERTCTKDDSHVETETVIVTEEVTQEPTYEAEGKKILTAVFENEDFETQTKEDSIPAVPKPTPTPTLTPTPTSEATPTPAATPTPTPEATPTSIKVEDLEKTIKEMKSEADLDGAEYISIRLKSTKIKKNSISYSWQKVSGATKYVIYANKCSKKNHCFKIAEVTDTKFTLDKIDGKKLKKGTYYKFLIVAADNENNVIATSKVVHASTKGGKYTNYKSISINKNKKIKKGKLTLKKGKSFKLKVKTTKGEKKKKLNVHRKISFESSDTSVATVSKSGKIKAVAPGECVIYAYTQNGLSKSIKVVVK